MNYNSVKNAMKYSDGMAVLGVFFEVTIVFLGGSFRVFLFCLFLSSSSVCFLR